MKRIIFAMSAVLTLTANFAVAQDDETPINLRRDTETIPKSVTPEMWLYEQERTRYEDPKAAVRRKAEFRSAQRQERLASQKWYGLTPARPTLSVTPWHGPSSPAWFGNGHHFNRWEATWSFPQVVVRPQAIKR